LGEAFYVLNADVFWLNAKVPALARLRRAWDDTRLDALLLVQRTVTAIGYDGLGDFTVDPVGRLRRRGEREVAPHLFAGVEILSRRFFDGSPDGAFSLNLLWNRAIEAGRIEALIHDGEWFHVGTPQGLAATEERLRHHGVMR
jgi:N-acetyl-alpha-D-muramate 1-phosphate uridylyltransferase